MAKISLIILLYAILGPLAVDCFRAYNAPVILSSNRIGAAGSNNNNNNNKAGSTRIQRFKHNDPAVKDCEFAFQLYRQLSSSNGDANVLLSPLSVLTAVSALAEGANGTTAKELLSAMNRSAADGALHRTRTGQVLDRMAKAGGGVQHTLTVASRVYVQKDFRLLDSYVQTLRQFYRTEATSVDFGVPHRAERSINDWVTRATQGRISSLVPPGTLDMQTRLVLANAVYFKGEWETTFPEANTRLRPFHHKKGKSAQVPTMSLETDFPYGDFPKLGFEMLELRYAGGEASMFVVLPYAEQSLGAVLQRLSQRPRMLAKPGRRLRRTEITVLLPKFSVEESVDLKATLVALGAKQVFEQGKADLSGITGNRELYVSDALHKAVVEVSEVGTKAAAATAFVLKGRSMSSDPVFRADRPFLFFIRHNPTETILFLGHVKQLKDAAPYGPKFENFD